MFDNGFIVGDVSFCQGFKRVRLCHLASRGYSGRVAFLKLLLCGIVASELYAKFGITVDVGYASVGACEVHAGTAVSDNRHHDREAASSRSAALLDQIAELLDVPKAALVKGAASEAEIDATTEMLRIWSSLENAADRRKVLAFARALAAGRR